MSYSIIDNWVISTKNTVKVDFKGIFKLKKKRAWFVYTLGFEADIYILPKNPFNKKALTEDYKISNFRNNTINIQKATLCFLARFPNIDFTSLRFIAIG